jgi:fucose permease
MNWLHASFAAGATVAPLWITFLLNSGLTWRWGFGSVAFMPAFLTLLVLATLRHWQTDTDTDTNPKIPSATIAQTLRLPTVWLGIIIFAVYAGAEGTMGQWAFSLFNEGRGVLAATAGIWVSFYWGGLLVGRMLVPLLMVRWGIKGVMRLCLVGSILVSVLIWLNLSATLDFIALTLMGFFFAPIFPTLMSATPGRVGQKYAGNTIGFQVAAADIGIAGFPALAGILASTTSLEAIPPFIALTCLIMWGLYEIMRR